jgi:SAM-dependent methyltransferase
MPTTPIGFAADAFVGTAEYYLRYRLPYPNALFEDLLARLGAVEAGRMLDLGCGPGRIALDLAARFSEVWAIDFEPEMIEVGRAEAARRGVSNVRWIVGASETADMPAGGFDLVTAGEAFHRFHQRLIVPRILGWLRPGGALAIIGGEGAINGDADWQRTAQAVVHRFTDRPSPSGPTPTDGIVKDEALLRAAGFSHVASYDFTLAHEWTAEAVIGHLYSTSYCSKAALGDRVSAFEAALTAALLAVDPAGRYRQFARFGYTFARKPARR